MSGVTGASLASEISSEAPRLAPSRLSRLGEESDLAKHADVALVLQLKRERYLFVRDGDGHGVLLGVVGHLAKLHLVLLHGVVRAVAILVDVSEADNARRVRVGLIGAIERDHSANSELELAAILDLDRRCYILAEKRDLASVVALGLGGGIEYVALLEKLVDRELRSGVLGRTRVLERDGDRYVVVFDRDRDLVRVGVEND